jgi:hypothetical protein
VKTLDPAEKVQALIAGLYTSFDDPRQQVVCDMTATLIAPRVVPQGLFDGASCADPLERSLQRPSDSRNCVRGSDSIDFWTAKFIM